MIEILHHTLNTVSLFCCLVIFANIYFYNTRHKTHMLPQLAAYLVAAGTLTNAAWLALEWPSDYPLSMVMILSGMALATTRANSGIYRLADYLINRSKADA